MTREMLERARRLCELGFGVIPLNGKDPDFSVLPRDENGKAVWKPYQTTQPTDAELQAWFGNGAQRNIGVVARGASGVVVVDTDTPETEAWAATNLPVTPMMTRTARGTHRYYRRPVGNDIPAFIKADGLEIEVKRDGQYVVGPGSVHPGKPEQNIPAGHIYAEVAPWPDTIDALPVLPPSVFGAGGGKREPVESLPTKVTLGSRNTQMFRAACRLRAMGWTRAEILNALIGLNRRRCEPALESRELETIAKSATRYPPGPETPSTEDGHRNIRVTFADTIKPRPVRWLWDKRLAHGTLALLAGREGIGKTTVAYTLVADLTKGRLPGASHGTPRTVIVAATEDSWAETIIPRLIAADADLARVGRVDVTTSSGDETVLSLPRDVTQLAEIIEQENAAMVLLDPLISRLESKLDTHKDADVRLGLEPLVRLADVTGTSVLGIIHVNKSSSRDPLNMVMGSRAFTAVARSVLFVAEDSDDETGIRRMLGQAKNNLGRCDLPTLTFEIEDALVGRTEEGDIRTGKLFWTGETARSIREVVEDADVPPADRTAKREAGEWLRTFLENNHGLAESLTVKREGAKAGHSESALKRARKELRITSQTTKTFPNRTFWLLPGISLDLCTVEKSGDVQEPCGRETRVEI